MKPIEYVPTMATLDFASGLANSHMASIFALFSSELERKDTWWYQEGDLETI